MLFYKKEDVVMFINSFYSFDLFKNFGYTGVKKKLNSLFYINGYFELSLIFEIFKLYSVPVTVGYLMLFPVIFSLSLLYTPLDTFSFLVTIYFLAFGSIKI